MMMHQFCYTISISVEEKKTPPMSSMTFTFILWKTTGFGFLRVILLVLVQISMLTFKELCFTKSKRICGEKPIGFYCIKNIIKNQYNYTLGRKWNAILLIIMYGRSVVTHVYRGRVWNQLHHVTYETTVIADIGSTY